MFYKKHRHTGIKFILLRAVPIVLVSIGSALMASVFFYAGQEHKRYTNTLMFKLYPGLAGIALGALTLSFQNRSREEHEKDERRKLQNHLNRIQEQYISLHHEEKQIQEHLQRIEKLYEPEIHNYKDEQVIERKIRVVRERDDDYVTFTSPELKAEKEEEEEVYFRTSHRSVRQEISTDTSFPPFDESVVNFQPNQPLDNQTTEQKNVYKPVWRNPPPNPISDALMNGKTIVFYIPKKEYKESAEYGIKVALENLKRKGVENITPHYDFIVREKPSGHNGEQDKQGRVIINHYHDPRGFFM